MPSPKTRRELALEWAASVGPVPTSLLAATADPTSRVVPMERQSGVAEFVRLHALVAPQLRSLQIAAQYADSGTVELTTTNLVCAQSE